MKIQIMFVASALEYTTAKALTGSSIVDSMQITQNSTSPVQSIISIANSTYQFTASLGLQGFWFDRVVIVVMHIQHQPLVHLLILQIHQRLSRIISILHSCE